MSSPVLCFQITVRAGFLQFLHHHLSPPTFDLGGGILWRVSGKDIAAEKAGDTDFSVETGTDAIPADILGSVAGEKYSIQLSLAHEGEFGFTAVLSVSLGRENAGHYASLYYYREADGSMEFICESPIAEDGAAELAFTHASDYAVVIDENPTDGSVEGLPGAAEKTADNEKPETGSVQKPWLFIAITAIIIFAGAAIYLAIKKKGKK